MIAGIGETLTERAGITNLSLDGAILLSAMTGFAVALTSDSVLLGFLAAMVVGALVALVVAAASIELRQDQVAVGFVLTMLCTDLSSFLGNPFVRKPGPSVSHLPLPGLDQLPVVGPIFFDQNPVVYVSLAAIALAWIWIFRTRPGLVLQGVGERPAAAFARGANVRLQRYAYTLAGGAMVGFAGAAYSLSVKLGWSYHHTFGTGLDRPGHRDLWRLGPAARGPGRLLLRRAGLAGQLCAGRARDRRSGCRPRSCRPRPSP